MAPAGNLHLCAGISLATAVLVLVEAAVLRSKAAFALAAAPTAAAALLLVWLVARRPRLALEDGLAGLADGVGLGIRPAGAPAVASVVAYCAGVIACFAGYAWLALTPSGIRREDVIVQWGLLDKRPLVMGYLAVVGLVVFHHAMMHLFIAPRWPAPAPAPAPRRGWIGRVLGAAAVACLAYALFGAAALRELVPADGALGRFYEYHSLVHLGALEQIRQGAMPYLEAPTQYGLGNQLLTYWLTAAFGFSNHGFFAGVLLIDVACIVAFFVVVQQVLGFGWAVAALVGWVLWPSPAGVLPVAGWAILTRWIAVPVLALLLARFLLAPPPRSGDWLAPLALGALWGAGGFASQENLSGGLLVFLLSLALYGPVCGAPLAALARFAGLFVAGGAGAFLLLMAGTIGVQHGLQVLRQASAQSGMVMAGLSNSVWSDNAGLTLDLQVVHGWLSGALDAHGPLRPLLQTYGLALLLMLSIGLLARVLGRGGEARFAWKFGGVAVGAYVLHLFTLLRSDLSHLAGPSFLLPLFLLMLPAFAWRCLRPGVGRGLLLLVSVALIADAAIAGRGEVVRRASALADVGSDTMAALDVYRALRAARDRPLDALSRYSPLPQHQAALAERPAFAELQELAGLLHDRLRGRRVELVLPTPDDPMNDPELLYFFGGFRSVTGITSPRGSIWLKSDEAAWIDALLGARDACVFFDGRTLDSRLYRAWNDVARNGPVTSEPIVGRRDYGVLSCRAGPAAAVTPSRP